MISESGGRKVAALVGLFGLLMVAAPVLAADAGLDQACVLRLAETADDAMTLAEIRMQCTLVAEPVSQAPQQAAAKPESAVEKRLAAERERPAVDDDEFSGTVHNGRRWASGSR